MAEGETAGLKVLEGEVVAAEDGHRVDGNQLGRQVWDDLVVEGCGESGNFGVVDVVVVAAHAGKGIRGEWRRGLSDKLGPEEPEENAPLG